MKIDKELIPYLQGKEFSSGLSLKISVENKNIDRLSYIEQLCKNTKVVHVGFADHLPLIAEKIRNNTWLHKRLMNVSAQCIGVDIDKEAFDFIQTNYSFPSIYHHDIINDQPLTEITKQQWDFLVLGEILEHINDPVLFLSALKNKYGPYVKKIVITVPNAFDLTNIREAKNNKEFINSDHRYWFTPYTLAKVGSMAGLQPLEFEFSQTHQPHKWYYRKIVQKYAAFRETLIMIFEF